MRVFLAASIIATVPSLTLAQGVAPYERPAPHSAPQAASCQTIALTISKRAEEGFVVLNSSEVCAAFHSLQNAYSALDSGRMQCGRGWAQQLALLEMDLLDALDYAGESCGVIP